MGVAPLEMGKQTCFPPPDVITCDLTVNRMTASLRIFWVHSWVTVQRMAQETLVRDAVFRGYGCVCRCVVGVCAKKTKQTTPKPTTTGEESTTDRECHPRRLQQSNNRLVSIRLCGWKNHRPLRLFCYVLLDRRRFFDLSCVRLFFFHSPTDSPDDSPKNPSNSIGVSKTIHKKIATKTPGYNLLYQRCLRSFNYLSSTSAR